MEGGPVAGGFAGAAVDHQVGRAIGDVGVEVVHEHAHGGFQLPSPAAQGCAARGADDWGHGFMVARGGSASRCLVPVSVCDPFNRPVTGLEKDHFKLYDDKVEQTVTHFAMDDEPVAVGLVFDISGSMGPKLRTSREAAAQFFKTANPEDEFFLVEFNDTPRLVVPLGREVPDIQNQLTFAQSKGRTALLDAVFLALHELKKSQKNRKALLIISDGGDNCSRYSETEVRNLVRESDTPR